ncbi:cation antiporter [Segniliparus rotundus DSM 44985]|uniref:Cation antiporter n=1 Tax=Segniliparus rotundus (strain ATCC BAA-972 / CDC 1076 / CIP 108378 / DSM 44985 / JCM 13578) TaxID=640132 RepID=D6ZB96_SEGRD|nr:Na+/H+ antiporter subunit E [Segniliparus rotundus]ADG96855.1 cation antiporter [Segniliparus rotundus DSM 44985]
MSRLGSKEQIRELVVRGGAIIWLIVVWVLLWGEATPLIVGSGVLVSVSVIVFLPLPRVPVGTRVRLGSLFVLCLLIARDLVVSSFQVAWYAVRPAGAPPSGIQWVKLRMSSDLVLTLAILALTLIPGTVVLAIDRVHRRVQVHLIPSRNEADVKKFEAQTAALERWFSRAFEQGKGK